MRACLPSIILLLICITGRAETLRELLIENHLPATSFNPQELDQTVQGEAKTDARQTILVYNEIRGELLAAPLHIIQFGPKGNLRLRQNVVMKPEDNCDGSILQIAFLHNFTVLSTHINPSASCLVFFDCRLRIVRRIYGIGWNEVAPEQLAIVENTIHFASDHPERLQIANLRHPGAYEVYPLRNDALRRDFVAEHAKLIPSETVCAANNDPCRPEVFDEDILSLTTDGKGRFAFLASLNAIHAQGAELEPESVLSTAILYIYRRNGTGWLYCEKSIPDSDFAKLREQSRINLNPAASCIPTLQVIPNLSTASYSPFPTN